MASLALKIKRVAAIVLAGDQLFAEALLAEPIVPSLADRAES